MWYTNPVEGYQTIDYNSNGINCVNASVYLAFDNLRLIPELLLCI